MAPFSPALAATMLWTPLGNFLRTSLATVIIFERNFISTSSYRGFEVL